jgi:hypothetical protein
MNKASPRSRLTNEFIEALAADWAQHGNTVIEEVRKQNPTRYAEIVSRLVPQEVAVSGQHYDGPDLAAMTTEEREDYLLDLMEKYLVGIEEVQLANDKRERIRSFRALAIEDQAEAQTPAANRGTTRDRCPCPRT